LGHCVGHQKSVVQGNSTKECIIAPKWVQTMFQIVRTTSATTLPTLQQFHLSGFFNWGQIEAKERLTMRKPGETENKQKTSYIENSIQTMHLLGCKCKLTKRKKNYKKLKNGTKFRSDSKQSCG